MTTYDESWSERAQLGERQVGLRLLRPTDRERISEGFHDLSDQGRYQRFLSAKTRLSEKELTYLTELDHDNHLAIGAIEIDASGAEGRGLGVARFICDADEPSVAEAAVAVIDDAQGMGLGRLLFDHLVEAAKSRGVQRFRGELLASNQAALHLLESVGAPVLKEIEDGITQVEVELPGARHTSSKAYDLLKLAATDKLRIRRFLWWLD